MRIWIYVEGKSDKDSLTALWRNWSADLRVCGHGLSIISLNGKPNFLKKIGGRAATKLMESNADLVVALPDLYPNKGFIGEYAHVNFTDLCNLQRILVKRLLRQQLKAREIYNYMNRFCASALKHDLEMLLLAAHDQLWGRIGLKKEGSRIVNPESVNHDKPPKEIVKSYFSKNSKEYREVIDAQQILQKASLRDIVLAENGGPRCPAFKEMLDWVGEKTGVPAYRP